MKAKEESNRVCPHEKKNHRSTGKTLQTSVLSVALGVSAAFGEVTTTVSAGERGLV